MATSVQNRFVDEELNSGYTYPNNYAVKPLAEQIEMLAKYFNLDGTKALAYAENLPELPEGAEGWFAIPRWQALAETYGQAVEKTLELIGMTRKFRNWRKGQLGEEYLRQSERTEQMLDRLFKQQEGEIIIIPAQFGLRHRGRSVRRAREVFASNEFGLGVFEVGCMLLIHPEREQTWEQLHIDCAGDEYAAADDQFVYATFFVWYDGQFHSYTDWAGDALKRYVSVSGFLPQ